MKAPSELPLCDIVMEGGITSGIIYPRAVVKLSEKFRIKNIGGTSAGAIAAAATAAAELGRARDPQGNPGFTRLAALPAELARTSPHDADSTRLLDLFQPSERTRPLFTLLIAALNAKTASERTQQLLLGAMLAFCERFYIAAALPLIPTAIFSPDNAYAWVLSALLGLVLGFATLLYSFWRVLTGPVVAQGYGICRGYQKGDEARFLPGDSAAPLTLWLSRLLDECAGKPVDGAPLTFGELWAGAGAAAGRPAWLEGRTSAWKYIDLQMMTTNVTQARPYRFPLAEDEQRLFFDEDELRQWFPEHVIKHMTESVQRKGDRPAGLPATMHRLPDAEDLPVVFATRLSLSFPLLLSAVPLYAIDFENRRHDQRGLERCWFSDGGISSNFPIHFFDVLLPQWPTFGLKLEGELTKHLPIKPLRELRPHEAEDHAWDPASHSTDETNRFFFPATNGAGRGESWARFDGADIDGSAKLLAFAGGLLNAARNWRDRLLTRAPGVRDRVIRLYLKDNEGGLNLKMEPELVTRLAGLGEQAAERLIARFAASAPHAMDMDNHRWIRLRNLAAVLESDLCDLHHSIEADPPHTLPYRALIAQRMAAHPDKNAYSVDAEQAGKLNRILDNLAALSKEADVMPKLTDGPKRRPVIRIVPNV